MIPASPYPLARPDEQTFETINTIENHAKIQIEIYIYHTVHVFYNKFSILICLNLLTSDILQFTYTR